MNKWWYSFYFLIIGVVSFFTGEIVTFIMLSFILLSLNNINSTLKKIYNQNNKKNNSWCKTGLNERLSFSSKGCECEKMGIKWGYLFSLIFMSCLF